ncbi:MAG TPA: TSUP family transporter, partial [Xanthobacteraceae bacterium]|nr:TSUP family transporter [Xanthobacteraceae bacterium]
VSAIIAAQFGTLILQYADPAHLRWAMAALVLVIVVVLSTGWRYHGKPMLIVTILVGIAAGLMGGAVQIFGPPVVLFWLSSMAAVTVVRANFVVFFAIMAAALVVTYLWFGLLTADVIALAAFLAPAHILAMFLGAKFFHMASEQTYRRVAYVIITAAALVSMPLWDGWLR